IKRAVSFKGVTPRQVVTNPYLDPDRQLSWLQVLACPYRESVPQLRDTEDLGAGFQYGDLWRSYDRLPTRRRAGRARCLDREDADKSIYLRALRRLGKDVIQSAQAIADLRKLSRSGSPVLPQLLCIAIPSGMSRVLGISQECRNWFASRYKGRKRLT